MVKAILHTPTRVIRRITIMDLAEINVAADETLVDGLPADFNVEKVNGKFAKLDVDNKTKLASTDQEALDAGVDRDAVAAYKRQLYLDLKAAFVAYMDTIDDVVTSCTNLEGAAAGTAVNLLKDFGTKQRISAQKNKAYMIAYKNWMLYGY